jgi:exodeoxyribonuclease V beta subunit
MKPVKPFDVFQCDLDGISLIEASAGTGKTWNICGLYLRLLLERELEVRQILVVTFTNAATAELRDRIRQRILDTRRFLAGEAPANGDAFIPDLIATLQNQRNIAPNAMIKRLELALQTFDEASIFTIHAFCQRALTDTPFSAGQAFSQELLPDDSELMLEVVHDFWRRHVANETLSGNLAAYLLQRGDTPERFAALLKRHLAKPLAIIKWPDEDASEIDYAALTASYVAARNCWQSDRTGIIDMLIASSDVLKQTSYKENQIRNAAANYDAYFKPDDPMTGVVSIEQTKNFRASSLAVGKGTKNNMVPPQHQFFGLAEDMLALRENTEEALQLTRLRLVRDMLEICAADIRRRKRERRVFSFDDILFNVYDALEGQNDSPLAQSLRMRYPAALVDEFQDTDPLQLSIFKTIYGQNNGSLFLVGDPKQAIYGFRNADLHTYLKAKQESPVIYSIGDNQRSTGSLIHAMNALFAANPQVFMLEGISYQEAGLGKKARKEFSDHSGANASMQIWMLPKSDDGTPILRNRAKESAVKATASEIARLLTAAEQGSIAIDDQPLRAHDIAVLVRSHVQGSMMRHALSELNIGSIEQSQASVFHSTDAEEIERVLTAVCSPARTTLLRAALATELIGCTADDISRISADDSLLMQYLQRFAGYRDAWLQRGIGYAYRLLLLNENVSTHMLRRPDGERRMTNLLHLGELLHQAEQTHESPDALLRWLQTQRRKDGDEAAQLRLESDQNLVQIITIHKAKGLEFPVVFCPFLWDGHARRNTKLDGTEYHLGTDTIIDFRAKLDDEAAVKKNLRLERDAEDMRLMYVALSRAIYRCYLIAGCYGKKTSKGISTSESTRSLLNWLAAGNGSSPTVWTSGKHTVADIEAAWEELARGGIQFSALPAGDGAAFITQHTATNELILQPVPKRMASGWRTSSFSGLKRGAVHENAASDYDAQLPASISPSAATSLSKDDILLFPSGANAGECIHKAFELCDFTDPASWKSAIERALSAHPQGARNNDKPLPTMMTNMMRDVLSTSLPDGIVLNQIHKAKRLNELGFYLPSSRLSADTLNRTLLDLGYDTPRLSFHDLNGYLNGFIDLVFEHEGRYYILDWKSNHLGNTATDYRQLNLAEAMSANSYHLQYLLYSVALDHFLNRRIHDYRYDAHFGGVMYLFVRGVRPGWLNENGSASGVFFDRPSEGTIRRLGNIISFNSLGAA